MEQTTSAIPSDTYAPQRTQTTASRLHVVESCHAIMPTRPTNGGTSGWSSLRFGVSTSRQQVGTRERTRLTHFLGRYVICFARTSQPHRKHAYPNLPYESSIRVFYSSHTSHLARIRNSRANALCVNIFYCR